LKISVVICTFQGELYIQEQLESILRQTRPVDEILLLDDGSKDQTVELARCLLEKSGIRWQIIQNQKNVGVARNFEQGIRKSQGDIVLTSDQDDVWTADKAEHFEKIFLENPNCVLAFSDAKVTDSNLQVLRESLWDASGFGQKQQQLFREQKYFSVLFSDNVVTGAAMGIRKRFAEMCIPAPAGTLHDYWFALCAPAYGSILAIAEKDLMYRQHGKNVVGIPGKGWTGKLKRWVHTVEIMQKDRTNRRIRAQMLYDYLNILRTEKGDIEITKAQLAVLIEDAKKWMDFSSWRDSLNEKSRINGISQILFHALQGDYRRYVKKPGIVMQEIASCFLHRNKEEA